ncbi:cytochrome P450 [Saccharothrix syringae]|uniref:Cytochrome P450 n=1 Tax=Saccharothrix syringae TaxID=103733 RepID=A0A5Q0GZ22_SACSY|nr:cytochrome P450 [Saccharothrix syringae]QFZ18770.1 cytochrome P450 [Saccharothrix syringae]
MTQQLAVPHLDISSERFRMNSREMRRARADHWYARTDWGIAVLTYEDCKLLLKNPHLTQGSAKWPAHHGVVDGLYDRWWRKTLLVLEGDEHNRIRRLVNPAFSPRRIEPLRPRFRALADSLVDEWVDDGRTEFAGRFAAPYSTRVLCMMLGIDEHDWEEVYQLSSTIGLGIGITIKENIARIDDAVAELTRYAESLVAARRRSPRDDILSALVGARDEDDGRLSDQELINLIILLVFAGIDTTRNQLVLTVASFSEQPDQWEKLAADPDRYAAKAAEEALRVNPIARWVSREAGETFRYRERTIEKGTTIHLLTLSSGTDPAEYDDPDRIDLDADRSPHLAFGGGMHHCLGHFVARADIDVAVSALSTRLTDLRVGEDAEWLPDSGNTGANTLPITFTRRP